MKIPIPVRSVVVAALFLSGSAVSPSLSGATTLGGKDVLPGKNSGVPPKVAVLTKDEIVAKYITGCRTKPFKEGDCDKIRKDAVEILKEDIRTLGSSAQRIYLPAILEIFKSDEVILRIAAADAIGMIGPQDSDAELLAPLSNDPVPDVRLAVGQAIGRGKGPSLNLLGQRVMSGQTGLTPDSVPDPGKLPVPVPPQSTYLYYASDPAYGRLSYVAKNLNEVTAFYKGKVKKGPFTWDEFQEKYRFQLGDEDRARSAADDAESAKQEENFKPDPANMQATLEKMQQMNAAQAKRMKVALHDVYQSNMFDKPTVYVLEERQIGSRTYPTRYVVLYQDVALKRPGYRLSWMTLSDDAIKTAQADTLKDEQQEAAGKKRQEALEDLVKKKDDTEKKKFKKGQSDLEKELGF
jgi:hypothetical protein